ncbi:MAG: hypothetical protein FJW23_10980 [Acidimicrobiia bacterium]|nr:hypothetical protein [Acidimicrobiia bacterium]
MAQRRLTFDARMLAPANTLILFTVIVLITLRWSEWGGPDSYFNSVTVALLTVLLALNLQLDRLGGSLFALPMLFLSLSMLVNGADSGLGTVRSGISAALALGVFALGSIPLSRTELGWLIRGFLAVCLGIALYRLPAADLSPGDGFQNFNENANAAAIFFLFCTFLALLTLRGLPRWLAVVAFASLVLATQSRTGVLATVLGLATLAAFGTGSEADSGSQARLRLTIAGAMVILMVVAIEVLPQVLVRLRSLETGRTLFWETAFQASVSSAKTTIFGTGPATAGLQVQRTLLRDAGSHNAYLDAAASVGYPYLISLLCALAWWVKNLVRDGHREILWVVGPVMLVGMTEATLFSGPSTLWFGLAFAGLWLRAHDEPAAEAHRRVPAPIPRRDLLPPRREPPPVRRPVASRRWTATAAPPRRGLMP